MSKKIKVKVFSDESFVKNNKGEFAKGGETISLDHTVAANLIARGKVYDLADDDAVAAAKVREKLTAARQKQEAADAADQEGQGDKK